MKTTYEIQTGRRVGPKLSENPWNNFGGSRRKRVAGSAVPQSKVEMQVEQDIRALAAVQASRPLRPVGKR